MRKLGIKTPRSKIPLVGDKSSRQYKMNEIVNKLLLGADKFMFGMSYINLHLTIVLVDHLLKQTNNTKIKKNKRLKTHLSKRAR